MMPKIEIHILAHNEEKILKYALRHYRTFKYRIVVHDADSTDGTKLECLTHDTEVVPWPTDGLNDSLACTLKNECWDGTDADWVICVDADELIYFPEGAESTLDKYERSGAAIIRPYGFEMWSEVFPTGKGHIYDEVKTGARDDKWYGKPVLFSPKRIRETGFGIGAHEALPILNDGRMMHVGQNWPHPNPPTYLLHFHQIGPIESIAERYDATRKRLSSTNEKHRWGNFKSGIEHAQEKRDFILANLERVIP